MPDPLAGFPPRYLRTQEAARFLGLSPRTMEKHRTYGTGPRYSKLGGRVVYRVDDLQAWVAQGAKASTSDETGQSRVARQAALRAARPLCGPRAPLTARAVWLRRPPPRSERASLDVFEALSGPVAPRDQRDLMERPFFSLAKAKRVTPIHYQSGSTEVQVYAVPEHGLATIWDADVLIWAGSQLVEALDRGLPTSRFFRFTPYQLLTAIGRATGNREYSAPARRARAPAVDRHPHDPPPGRALAAPAVLLDQRVGGARDPRRADRGHGVRAPGLVLPRVFWIAGSSSPSTPATSP